MGEAAAIQAPPIHQGAFNAPTATRPAIQARPTRTSVTGADATRILGLRACSRNGRGGHYARLFRIVDRIGGSGLDLLYDALEVKELVGGVAKARRRAGADGYDLDADALGLDDFDQSLEVAVSGD